MASSLVTDDFTYIGFYQKNKKDGWQVGEALNEGFTNSLDYRLFKDIIPCKEKTIKEVYPISTRICDNLEFTLETKRLLDSYFKADLKTIYEYLSKLMGKDATLAFLYSYDALFRCCDDCSKIRPIMLRLLYPDIDIYVAEAFYTKITDKYRSGALDSASYKDYLEVVREILMDRIWFDKIPITPKVIGAYPYIEKRYNDKYKIREKNNCLVK